MESRVGIKMLTKGFCILDLSYYSSHQASPAGHVAPGGLRGDSMAHVPL